MSARVETAGRVSRPFDQLAGDRAARREFGG
jgi:hypothetical protein